MKRELNILKGEQKRKKIKQIFRIEIKAQEAKAIAPLSPTLGQYGISCQDFCREFNEKTKNFEIGVPIRITFMALINKEYYFSIGKIKFRYIIESLEKETSEGIFDWLDLYKLSLVFTKLNYGKLESNLKTIIGILESMEYKCIKNF
jgi:hypothetical protein